MKEQNPSLLPYLSATSVGAREILLRSLRTARVSRLTIWKLLIWPNKKKKGKRREQRVKWVALVSKIIAWLSHVTAYETPKSWGSEPSSLFLSGFFSFQAGSSELIFRSGRQNILWAKPWLQNSSYFVFWQITSLLPLRTPMYSFRICQREVPDSVFWAFYCFPTMCVCLVSSPSSEPSHPKNRRGERDLWKYIKISVPFSAQLQI